MKNMYTTDWHIHTVASCDATMTYKELIKSAKEAGITDFGITEHVDYKFMIRHLQFSRKMFETDYVEGMHFGVELNPVPYFEFEYARNYEGNIYPPMPGGQLPQFVEGFGHDPELLRKNRENPEPLQLAMTEEEIRANKVEYVIAATHYVRNTENTPESNIRDFHHQQMFCATDSRVDVVGHPWWGVWSPAIHFETIETGKMTERCWFQDFGIIPQSMHDEFAAALLETGKSVEMSISALINPAPTDKYKYQYAEYIRMLFERGIPVTIGTDSHDNYRNEQEIATKFLGAVGFKAEDFSMPRFRVYEDEE